MTTETKLISSVENVCKQLGYGKVIDALRARWALSLMAEGTAMSEAAEEAGLGDLAKYIKPEDLEKVLRSLGQSAC